MPTEYSFTCATCDHAITGRPVFHLGLAFCCAGCAADGPCSCSYDVEPVATAAAVVRQPELSPAEEPAVTEEPITVAATAPAGDLVGAGR